LNGLKRESTQKRREAPIHRNEAAAPGEVHCARIARVARDMPSSGVAQWEKLWLKREELRCER
jgi:hypothetical protein